jgi:hypothetical protein
MKHEQHIQILKNYMLPSFHLLNKPHVFQHDNDPKLVYSQAAIRWLSDNGVRTLSWPAQSSDLDPIEHLWDVLQTKLEDRGPTNKDDLWRMLQEGWQRFPPRLLKQ